MGLSLFRKLLEAITARVITGGEPKQPALSSSNATPPPPSLSPFFYFFFYFILFYLFAFEAFVLSSLRATICYLLNRLLAILQLELDTSELQSSQSTILSRAEDIY